MVSFQEIVIANLGLIIVFAGLFLAGASTEE